MAPSCGSFHLEAGVNSVQLCMAAAGYEGLELMGSGKNRPGMGGGGRQMNGLVFKSSKLTKAHIHTCMHYCCSSSG